MCQNWAISAISIISIFLLVTLLQFLWKVLSPPKWTNFYYLPLNLFLLKGGYNNGNEPLIEYHMNMT